MTQTKNPVADILPGDPAPTFKQRTHSVANFKFDSAGGRYLVLCFMASAKLPNAARAVEAVSARPDLFNDRHASFFAVTSDPSDEVEQRLKERVPGYRAFWDFDRTVAQRYGVATSLPDDPRRVRMRQTWVIVDPFMQIMSMIPFGQGDDHIAQVIKLIDDLPPPELYTGQEIMAPVLVLPKIFEPELCRHLIGLYEADGGKESGFMQEVNGRTVGAQNRAFKSRRDFNIEEESLKLAIRQRIQRRVAPQLEKAYQFNASRMERYIVACYAAEDGGHFGAHRDNTTKGTAHRRFAVSINLNDDFEGGEVGFPEYGRRSFKAPAGSAVVFSCSLLHAVSKVTSGRRYAFLPFLYDEAAAALRQENLQYLDISKTGTDQQNATAAE